MTIWRLILSPSVYTADEVRAIQRLNKTFVQSNKYLLKVRIIHKSRR